MKLRWMIPLLAAALALSTTTGTFAQPATAPAAAPAATPATAPAGTPADERGGPFLQRLLEALDELKLSEDQRAEVRKIVDAARAEIRAAVQQMQGVEPRQRAQRIREIVEDVREQIAAVLDEPQREMLRQRIEEARRLARGREGRADAPATAPAGAPPGPEGRVAALAQRFRDAIEQLELSPETKHEAMKVADELRAAVRKAVADAQGDVEQLRTKVRELVNEARLDLQEILTPEQQERLRELLEPARRPMQRDRSDRPGPPEKPLEPMAPEQQAAPATAPSGAAESRSLAPPPPPPPDLRPGQAAPDFALEKLDGRPVQLSSFKGKLLVLLFGNYSSPGFRDRADDYEQLRRQFANRAEFVVVYTRESHPVGEWEVERNKHAHVLVEQPKTFEERKALARQAKQALKITIPIAIDTMDEKTAKDYGGFTTSAVVIGRDGRIIGHRTYADAHAVKRILEAAIAGNPTTSPS